MKKILLALLLAFSCIVANAQCDYINEDLEEWTTESIDLGAGAQDVTLPDNHVSSVRFLLQLIEIFIVGNPQPLLLFQNDPQLFMGIDQSADASTGNLAVKLQGDPMLPLADLWSVIACDGIQDSFKIDIKHVGSSSDTIFIYGAYDENVAPLPENQTSVDTLAGYFYYQIIYDDTSDYQTFTFPVTINDANAPVDTFSFLALAFYGSTDSYFLIDNIRFASANDDQDGDGYTADVDCDDNNAAVNPGAAEICDGIDNDCSGMADDGLTFQDYYLDADGDGYGSGAAVNDCQSPGADYVLLDGDCDDTEAAVNPGAVEICDGIDNDCSGTADDGLTFQDYYLDADGDGYGTGAAVNDCQSPGADYVLLDGDCDDTEAAVNPGSVEICDGLDNDCSGTADDGLTFQDYYLDADGDGYGTGAAINDCQSPGADYVLLDGDCDDTEAAVNPGAAEICDGLDNDCNNEIDDNVIYQDYYLDADGDGYGTGAAVNDCQSPGADYVLLTGDCDDTNPAISPGAAEVCDGLDNDCSGTADDGLTFQDYYLDADGDGYGTGAAINDCQSPGADYVLLAGDCDDTEAAVNPGAAEICDGLDNDCNGTADDGLTFQDYYLDADGDGYGTGAAVNDCQSPGAGYVLLDGDCDDTEAPVNPGAAEICDGLDNDCSGTADDGLTFQDYYLDADGDGYGTGTAVNDCQSPGTDYVLLSGDCNDTNMAVNPGATEICDGLDNDCNGTADDGLTFQDYYLDADGDGYGAGAAVNDCQSPGTDYVILDGDCDDTNADVNPGATESCNSLDDNCDGQVDEGVTTTYYLDADNDGYGDPLITVEGCSLPGGFVENAEDCDDYDPDVNPGATEIPANGIDDDCDGVDDPSNTDELSELGIRIFPNPVSETLWLENVPAVGYRVELVNLIGQTVSTSRDNVSIDCQHLPSGAYFIKITEEKTMRRKVSLVVKD